VLDYLPSPIDRVGIKVAAEEGQEDDADRRIIPAREDEPFAGLAFKIINDKYGN
jgi:elongation factor G